MSFIRSTCTMGKQAVVPETPSSISSSFEKPPSLAPLLSTDVLSEEPRFFPKRIKHDPKTIATQPSVFDEPGGVELYGPPAIYENAHRFDPDFRWTWIEEWKLKRKIDIRIFIFVTISFMCLELDRSNITQANSANFLSSLGLTTNDYNTGNTVFKCSFLAAELPSQLISKWIGPDRWLPAQLTLWSIVAASQFWLSGRSSFLATRALLGILQGGFIPDTILLLSYFYTNAELPIRLAWFWTAMYVADIISAFLAVPILRLDGVHGHHGWQYLFLIEGLLTLVVGLSAFFVYPASVTQTRTWFRPNGYFNEHEEKIVVNKILRDSPSKSDMHNRQRLTLQNLWSAATDYHLYPLYVIGLLFGIPAGPINQYLTLILKGLKFSTTLVNVLTVPSFVLNIIFLLSLTWLSERYKQRALFASLEMVWCIPLLAILIGFTLNTSSWAKYAVSMLLNGHPYSHAVQVAWVSRNANSVGGRTVSAALYNMFVQASSVIYSNIYRADDAPLYHKGNAALLGIAIFTLLLYPATFIYYRAINKRRERIWKGMSLEERAEYINTTNDRGSRRLDFRFVT